MWKSFVSELHGEWSEFADECIGLFSTIEIGLADHSVVAD
jgi:hypothetical protein